MMCLVSHAAPSQGAVHLVPVVVESYARCSPMVVHEVWHRDRAKQGRRYKVQDTGDREGNVREY